MLINKVGRFVQMMDKKHQIGDRH